ncbi:protein kinase-like domain, concanavalin A-like lectin/glucanase domain protein [Tanacetum coccineum]
MENLYPKHGLISRTYSKKSLIMASTFGSKSKFFMTMSLPSQDKPLTNRSVNDPRDFAKPVKAIALPHDVPGISERRLIELENQVQRLMEAYLTLTQPTQVNKITTSCEIYSGPHDTHVCIEDPEQACVDYASSCTNEIGSKSTYSDTEEDDSSTNECDPNLGGMVKGEEGVKEKEMEVDEEIEEEESEFETDEEVEEIIEEEEDEGDGKNFNSFPTMEELTHHEWLLKNPRPSWVKARIRARNPNNIKISCMIGHFFKRHAYIDLESPLNIMSKRQYNQIMTYGLRSRQKSSNLNKISNFVGRIRGLKIFIGSFAYKCDFMILEDTTSIIDHQLGEIVFGRPFNEKTGLVYNEREGAVMFKQDNEKITFKMPHTMKIFKQTRLMGLSTESIPPSAYEENFGHGRTHYYQSLLIRDEYKQDEGDRR